MLPPPALWPLALLLTPPPHHRSAASRAGVSVCVAADIAQNAPEDNKCPVELHGPWELSSTLSGSERLWVELDDEGAVSCSAKIGVGKTWSAVRKGADWTLQVTLLDKLKRPLTFKGTTEGDEYHALKISGVVMGPPRGAQSPAEATGGALVGEFEGHKLE